MRFWRWAILGHITVSVSITFKGECMNEFELLDKINAIIHDDLELDVTVSMDTWLLRDKVLDSLDWLSFLARIKELFLIDISSEEADKNQLGIVKNLISYISEKQR